MQKINKLFLLFIIPFLFQSCISLGIGSSKFSCPLPKTLNLKCMPPSKIYELSEKKQLYKLVKNFPKKKKDTCPCNNFYSKSNNTDINSLEDFVNIDFASSNQSNCCHKKQIIIENRVANTYPKNGIVLKQDNVDFLPVLEKPKILLIWFAYWIDKAGDLHSNEYVYVTVRKRFWAIGKRLFNQDRLLFSPLVKNNFLEIEEENNNNNSNNNQSNQNHASKSNIDIFNINKLKK